MRMRSGGRPGDRVLAGFELPIGGGLPWAGAAVAAVAMSSAAALALVDRGPKTAFAIALLPALLLAVGVLVLHPTIMLAAALVLPLTGIGLFARPIPVGSANMFPQDLIVMAGFGAWLAAVLTRRARGEGGGGLPRTPVLGWPFILFSVAILVAAVRGHYAYGATLFGQPMRLIVYAAIVGTLVGLTARSTYRLLLWLFYGGASVTGALALYYIATGTSQTDQFALSTGGDRILGISPSLYCAGALYLGLLSLTVARTNRARLLHLTMAAVGLFGAVVGFGRAVYLSVAIVGLVVLVFSRPIRSAVYGFLPLALPFVAVLAVVVPAVAPDLVRAVDRRLSAPPTSDANVQWRLKANRAVWSQVREQPLLGVGFGRTAEFYVDVESDAGVRVPVLVQIGQDPHNGYMWLWAGGGLAALGSFLLILAVYAVDSVRRLRASRDPVARIVVYWSGAFLFSFLLDAASGTSFESPADLLTIWTLLVIPAVVTIPTSPVAGKGSGTAPDGGRVSTRTPPGARRG